jgi:cystathionine beta-lyase/cystathionine gamma-synthase
VSESESADPAAEPRHADTRAVTAGRADNQAALAPLLWASTTFETVDLERAAHFASTPSPTRFYSRFGNPSVRGFEDGIADLEGAEAALATASGMGALTAVVLGICGQGNHIVSQHQLYGGTKQLLLGACRRFGIDVTLVDGADPEAWEAAVEPGRTVMALAETPANPRLDLVDLERFGALVGPIKVVDSTLATPMAQRPLSMGADLVVHSATKAIAGHNDATLGVIAGSRELMDWIWGFAVLQGASASPFDAMNGLRGLRTLPVRFARQSDSAQALAEFLEADPRIGEVRYPGLPSHPQYELGQRQMEHMGGILSFDLDAGRDHARKVCSSVTLMRIATSLGGPETLLTHPASTTHAGLTDEELASAGIGPGTMRVSVGLEHAEDLIADLEAALNAAAT